MKNDELIFIATLIPVSLVVMVVVIIVLFIQKKNRLLVARQEDEIKYLSEINKAKIEVKDAVLSQVANELHDNIGQMVALSVIYVKSLQKAQDTEKLNSLRELTESTLNEVRQLSKLLNQDLIERYDLVKAIEKLVAYLSKLNALKITFEVAGRIKSLDQNVEVIIFRMIQEFVSNSLKYAKCEAISIHLSYETKRLEIKVNDDGVGFDTTLSREGTGLAAISKRAEIINATAIVTSQIGKGTQLTINYNYN